MGCKESFSGALGKFVVCCGSSSRWRLLLALRPPYFINALMPCLGPEVNYSRKHFGCDFPAPLVCGHTRVLPYTAP